MKLKETKTIIVQLKVSTIEDGVHCLQLTFGLNFHLSYSNAQDSCCAFECIANMILRCIFLILLVCSSGT